MSSDYIQVFSGNSIEVKILKSKLEDIGISPIIKDASESARLAGFAANVNGIQALLVAKDELEKAQTIINQHNNPIA